MEQTEIRLLGPMIVRRHDGTVVEQPEWRTGKTADLLRILALEAGRPVPVASILERLWPDVDNDHGRASLRTAASQLRKVLCADTLERRPGSMVLHGAWVDCQSYAALASEVDRCRRVGVHAEAVALVRDAEALYVDDVEVPETSGDWLREVRDHWRDLRCRMLLDGAEAAGALGWMHDCLDLARRASLLDPGSERAARALMSGLAGVGEIEKAVGVFERLRRDLAEELGVDPSPQTRALHLQLLAGTAAGPVPDGLVGQEETVASLVASLAWLRRSGKGGGVVWLCGEPGSGRDSVAEAACRQLGLSVRNMNDDPDWLPRRSVEPAQGFEGPATDVVVMPRTETVPPHALGVLGALARRQRVLLVVPVRCRLHSVDGPGTSLGDVPTTVVDVPALTEPGLAALATQVFQGEPSDRLLCALRDVSGGLAGHAWRVARRWVAEGRLVWTVDGLALRSEDTAPPATDGSLRGALHLLTPEALDLVSVVAVSGTGVLAGDVAAVLGRLRPGRRVDVAGLLEDLVARGVLRVTRVGYRLREDSGRHELLAWLRPAVRQRLHTLVAEEVLLEPAQRAQHLLAAGRHRQAGEVVMDALEAAERRGDLDRAYALLELLEKLPAGARPAWQEGYDGYGGGYGAEPALAAGAEEVDPYRGPLPPGRAWTRWRQPGLWSSFTLFLAAHESELGGVMAVV